MPFGKGQKTGGRPPRGEDGPNRLVSPGGKARAEPSGLSSLPFSASQIGQTTYLTNFCRFHFA
jgi:hypothetical protein